MRLLALTAELKMETEINACAESVGGVAVQRVVRHSEFFNTSLSSVIARLEELKRLHGDVHVRIGHRGEPIAMIKPRFLMCRRTAYESERRTEIEILGSWPTSIKCGRIKRLRYWLCAVIFPKDPDA